MAAQGVTGQDGGQPRVGGSGRGGAGESTGGSVPATVAPDGQLEFVYPLQASVCVFECVYMYI